MISFDIVDGVAVSTEMFLPGVPLEKHLTQTAKSADLRAVDATVEVSGWRPNQVDKACASYWEEGWMAWRLENVRPVAHQATMASRPSPPFRP